MRKGSLGWQVQKVLALSVANKTLKEFVEGHHLQKQALVVKKQDSECRLSLRLEKRPGKKLSGLVAGTIGASSRLKVKIAEADDAAPGEATGDGAGGTAANNTNKKKGSKKQDTKKKKKKKEEEVGDGNKHTDEHSAGGGDARSVVKGNSR